MDLLFRKTRNPNAGCSRHKSSNISDGTATGTGFADDPPLELGTVLAANAAVTDMEKGGRGRRGEAVG